VAPPAAALSVVEDDSEDDILPPVPPPPPLATTYTPRSERANVAIAQMHAKVRKKSSKIVYYAMAGADIDDDSPKPEKWTERKYRVAKDARKPLKERPIYIQIALENHKAYVAGDAHKEAQPQLNANVVNVYVDRRVYETKEVKE
jgi:hypothetical protein